MSDLENLRIQYENLTYDDLINVWNNAVLPEDAMKILDDVLNMKVAGEYTGKNLQDRATKLFESSPLVMEVRNFARDEKRKEEQRLEVENRENWFYTLDGQSQFGPVFGSIKNKHSLYYICSAFIYCLLAPSILQCSETRSLGLLVSHLVEMVDYSPTRSEFENILSSEIPGHYKKYYKNGVYRGHIILENGKEIMFVFGTFKNDILVSITLSFPPTKNGTEVYQYIYKSLSDQFNIIDDNIFNLGKGYRAYIESRTTKSKRTSYAVLILK